jgi:(1->4)-alpha-D-glucan 1-alpha-D-glucosylmutase
MRHFPISTYRVQLNHRFRFADATRLVSYLSRLGVTDLYSSPHLKAGPGSMHGYDICDHTQLNPELGTEGEYVAFTDELREHGMGHVADIVPNHMGADPDANPWWRDVLEDGPSSPYARFFDIEWDPLKQELRGKILLPILGEQYGAVLDRGELRVGFEHGGFVVRYFERTLPLNPRQVPRLVEQELDALRADLAADDPNLNELLSILSSLRNLPAYTESEPERVAERHREKEVARQRLERLVGVSPRIRGHVDAAVAALNGVAGRRETFDALHELLELQPYRLANWRTASHEINYRRFFDINDLAGVRIEDPHVFEAAHALILRLVGEGRISGLRIDHVDGLFDPAGYLRRLQDAARNARVPAAGEDRAEGEGAEDLLGQRFYVAVEKILSHGEALPRDWQTAGTSGYDFLNDLNGLFVDRRAQAALERLYRRFTKRRQPFADLLCDCKQLIMDTSMASELNVLAHALNRISERNRHTRDFTLNSLREALREVVECFPVYRTYVTGDGFGDDDRRIVESTIARARRRNPALEASVFDFLRAALLPLREEARDEREHAARLGFAMKFQQYTGPLEAKGLEDTAFYRHNVLVSQNEVGADPERFGRTPAEFHTANERRRAEWPLAMLATATHDTKRGEDVRARLNVVSELVEDWNRFVSSSARINASNRTVVGGEPAPDRNDEYLFYQLLLGVWPPGSAGPAEDSFVARLREAMLKAAREAKLHTSWITPDEGYESAVARFVERALAGPMASRFLAVFLPLHGRVAFFGMLNSLAQVVLKVASPGVPDFYQGSELWDLSLVDPDNRRPVDYELRRRLLDELEPVLEAEATEAKESKVRELVEHWVDGRIKLFVTAAALRLRRRMSDVFLCGSYEPLPVQGAEADHVVALARRYRGASVIAVAPRLCARLADGETRLPLGNEAWRECRLDLPGELAASELRDAITGRRLSVERTEERASLRVADVLRTCPVALLETTQR